MNMGSRFLPSSKENLGGFSFQKQGLAHKRSGSELSKVNLKTDFGRFLTLLSPRDSCAGDEGPLTTRTQSEQAGQGGKHVAIIARLNEEIQILSTQLKESNEIISHFTFKLNEISANFLSLKEITEKFKLKNEELEKQVSFLTNKNKDLKKITDTYEKKLKSSQSQPFLHTTKNPEKLPAPHFQYNELIIKLNNHFLQGIDGVLEKLKNTDECLKSDELEEDIKEFKVFFSNECKSVLQKL